MKLGRLPARYDRRSLRLASYFPIGQIAAPPMLRDWSTKENKDWKTYRNLELSCCVPASFAHLVQTWTSVNDSEIEIPEDNVISAYKAISGYDGTPNTDGGCVMLDAMNFWRREGVGGHKILAYVAVDPTNRLEMEAAINLFGGVAIGVDMPLSVKGKAGTWDIADANHWTSEYRPGSWGGHAMACVGYSRTYATLVTWGRIQTVTRSWLHTYCEEAYAAISEDWVSKARLAPNGFDLAALEASLTAIA